MFLSHKNACQTHGPELIQRLLPAGSKADAGNGKLRQPKKARMASTFPVEPPSAVYMAAFFILLIRRPAQLGGPSYLIWLNIVHEIWLNFVYKRPRSAKYAI